MKFLHSSLTPSKDSVSKLIWASRIFYLAISVLESPNGTYPESSMNVITPILQISTLSSYLIYYSPPESYEFYPSSPGTSSGAM